MKIELLEPPVGPSGLQWCRPHFVQLKIQKMVTQVTVYLKLVSTITAVAASVPD